MSEEIKQITRTFNFLFSELNFEFFLITGIFLASFIIQDSFIYQVKAKCLSERIIGIPIGTCGMTRSIITISHFHFEKAMIYNPLGYYFYSILLLDFFYFVKLSLFKTVSIRFRNFILNLFILGGYLIIVLTSINVGLIIHNFLR